MPSRKRQPAKGQRPSSSGTGSTKAPRSHDRNKLARHLAIIILVTLGLYFPSFSNGYIWDDADYVYGNRQVQGLGTIVDIWFTHQTPQYYPLTFSSFWLEHKLWGLDPAGYHVVNCALHIANAVLLYFLMRKLSTVLALPVALVFAIHPIQVETVAWITERKNVLAAFFFLLAVHFYWQYEADQRFKNYLYSFAMFVLSLLSKSVTVSFVFVPLLMKWWKKQTIDGWDIGRIIPFVVVGVAAGLHTAWVEVHHVGARGAEWELSFWEKALLPGRIVLFYLEKIFVPYNFVFSYPRWELNPASVAQWLPSVIVLVLVALLFLFRESLGRGALATFAYFIISLFPALGIFQVYPMRYSFVADHFTYLSTIPIIMFMLGAYHFVLRKVLERRTLSDAAKQNIGRLILAVAAVVLGIGVVDHTRDFRDATTLWLHVLEGNPRSLLAYNSLGLIAKDRGDEAQAELWFNRGLEVEPSDVEIRNNLGILMAERNQIDLAFEHFHAAMKAKPDYPETYNNIATVYALRGQEDQAKQFYEKTLELSPRFTPALFNLGRIYRNRKQADVAIKYFERAIASDPTFAAARIELSAAYADLQKHEADGVQK